MPNVSTHSHTHTSWQKMPIKENNPHVAGLDEFGIVVAKTGSLFTLAEQNYGEYSQCVAEFKCQCLCDGGKKM